MRHESTRQSKFRQNLMQKSSEDEERLVVKVSGLHVINFMTASSLTSLLNTRRLPCTNKHDNWLSPRESKNKTRNPSRPGVGFLFRPIATYIIAGGNLKYERNNINH